MLVYRFCKSEGKDYEVRTRWGVSLSPLVEYMFFSFPIVFEFTNTCLKWYKIESDFILNLCNFIRFLFELFFNCIDKINRDK